MPTARSFGQSTSEDDCQALSPDLTSSDAPAALLITIACLYGASAVVLGAFGAHGLKKRIADPQRIANFGTAAQYQVRLS
jgi:hypothetical protein